MSIKGVHCGLRLPLSMEATSDAKCPTVRPLASTTYHFRLPARSLPLGKYVDIVNYLCFQRVKRERLEYPPLRKVVKAGAVRVHRKPSTDCADFCVICGWLVSKRSSDYGLSGSGGFVVEPSFF